MKVSAMIGLSMMLLLTAYLPSANAHCEIPCGIYNDQVRANLIEEHAGTIEKSMKMILELQKDKAVNYNQLVRWITNKDDHANKIQDIVTQYFMTQRVKPGDVAYAKKIKALHELLILSMKCKQTLDIKQVAALRKSLDTFRVLYFGNKKHAHPKK